MARMLIKKFSRSLAIGLFGLSSFAFSELVEVPGRHGMTDVTTKGANGTDQNSDQDAVIAAIANGGTFQVNKAVFFPKGTYILDGPVNMQGPTGAASACCTQFWGEGPGETIIKLKDNASGYGNAGSPKWFIYTPPGNMSFRYALYNLTVEIGTGNAGACAIDYIANNRGAIRNVEIKAAGEALVGLEMTRAWPGPCLIKDVVVRGFTHGIRLAQGQYGVTFEGITLEGQQSTGILNQGNLITINDMKSTNNVPAVQGGWVCIMNSELNSSGGSVNGAAVRGCNYVYARNVSQTGYDAAIEGSSDNPVVEYASNKTVNSLWGDPWGMLKLQIKNAPKFADNDTTKWVCAMDNLDKFSPSLKKSFAAAVAGVKHTVYVPNNGDNPSYPMYDSVMEVPPEVKRIIGYGCEMGPTGSEQRQLRIIGNTTEPLIIENINFAGVTLDHRSSRPVVIASCDIDSIKNSEGAGELFIEDMDCKLYLPHRSKVWIRQFNPEDLAGTGKIRIANYGAELCILGLKTEGIGTIMKTTNGALSEILGYVVYPVNADNLGQPAFVCEDACMSLLLVHFGGYQNMVREKRGTDERTLTGGQVSGSFYVANKGCDISATQPDTRHTVEFLSTAPIQSRRSLMPIARRISVPAHATGLTLYNVRGETIWSRTLNPGSIASIEIPAKVRAAGVACIKFKNK